VTAGYYLGRGLMWFAMLAWGYCGLWAMLTARRDKKPRYRAFGAACWGSAAAFAITLGELHEWAVNVALTAGVVAGSIVLAAVLVQQYRLRRAGR